MSDKRYEFTHPNGVVSTNQPLGNVMDAADRQIVFGTGVFSVLRANAVVGSRLHKADCLAMVKDLAEKIDRRVRVKVIDLAGDQSFTFKRVADDSPYKDPFRQATYSSMRIDAGVDYVGTGPIFPIGKAKIMNRGKPSGTWSFGTSMPVYKLLEGPRAGLMVYCDEHLQLRPGYATGDIVTVNTPLYDMVGAFEIGWSDGIGSIAWRSGAYSEGQLSVYGQDMSDFLETLGAKPGLTLGRSKVGTLPGSWPGLYGR